MKIIAQGAARDGGTGHRRSPGSGRPKARDTTLATARARLRVRACCLAVTLGLGLAAALPAVASGYPDRPIQLVVGYGAGGSTDVCFRALATQVSADLGQQVVIQNRPGAGSSLSISWLKAQPADGYSIGAFSTAAVLNQFLNSKTGYDVQRDLTPVALLARYQAGLLVRPDSPWKSVADVIEAARTRKDGVTFATAGIGTPQHLTISQLARTSKSNWVHVPFKGGVDATTAVVSGDVDVLSQTAEWAPYVRDGRLKLLAVYTETRMKEFPDAPTLKEVGYDIVAPSMFGVVGPKGLPAPIVTRLDKAFRDAAASQAFVHCADQFALKIDVRPADGFAKVIDQTVNDWAEVSRSFANE